MNLDKSSLISICQKAMQLLAGTNTQVDVVGKLNNLACKVAPSTFSQIINGKGAGPKTLLSVARGLQAIVSSELGMEWAGERFVKTAEANFQPKIIPAATEKTGKKGFLQFENARLPLSKKVAFFKDAQHEVIEFGVTLSRFSSNLTSGNRDEFRAHVEKLLGRGVHFRCYLLRADCRFSQAYFDDRHSVHPEEGQFHRKIAEAIDRLRVLQTEFAAEGYPGRFEVFEYEHIPYNYFMSVDGCARHGKLMVSLYLYGVRRSATPVFLIHRKDTPVLHQTYWDSFQALMKNARRIVPG